MLNVPGGGGKISWQNVIIGQDSSAGVLSYQEWGWRIQWFDLNSPQIWKLTVRNALRILSILSDNRSTISTPLTWGRLRVNINVTDIIILVRHNRVVNKWFIFYFYCTPFINKLFEFFIEHSHTHIIYAYIYNPTHTHNICRHI